VSVQAVYKQTWTAEVTYEDYLGAPNASYLGQAGLNGDADRGWVGLNLTHTF
jgi:hypothetical protein